jgi:hypothetical protein
MRFLLHLRLGPPPLPAQPSVPSPNSSGSLGLPPVVELPHPNRAKDVSGQQDELPLARSAHPLYG